MENVEVDSKGNDSPDLKSSGRSNTVDQFNDSAGSLLNSKTTPSSTDIARALPNNTDAEKGVLSAMLQSLYQM